MKIALGTAQFGLNYGVANSDGQVSVTDARAILAYAAGCGVDTLDTAIAYGESEQRLGEIEISGWQVITKLPTLPNDVSDVEGWVQESVQASCMRLGVPSLRGLLLHRPQELLGAHGEALFRAMCTLREQGAVEKIGVSIYNPEELASLWPRFSFDLVQAPFNIIDRRLATSGWLAQLSEAGVEVHVRSAFLQGLLLMKRSERPAKFGRWQSLWDQWDQWFASCGITPLQACLGFALSQPEISRVVVGVDSLQQVQEIIACAVAESSPPPATLCSSDEELINPSCWSSL